MKKGELAAAARWFEKRHGIPKADFIEGLAPRLGEDAARLAELEIKFHSVEEGVYANNDARTGTTQSVLIEFASGLGDSAQLSLVLQHLQKYRPTWQIDLTTWPGREGVGLGYCRKVWMNHERPRLADYDSIYRLMWLACDQPYHDAPSTQPVVCLRDVFKIDPDPELLKYRIEIPPELANVTGKHLETLGARWLGNGRTNAVAIHYEGTSEPENKNLSWEHIETLCKALKDWGYLPIVLDWRVQAHRVSTSQGLEIIKANPTGITAITALISQCSLMVGIDSGPGHCAGATETPTLIVWTKHHPLNHYDLCPNVVHLVPENHRSIGAAEDTAALQYFWRNYRWRTYRDLANDLVEAADDEIHEARQEFPFNFRTGTPLVRQDWFWQVPCHEYALRIFHHDAYQTFALSLGPKPVILDIGAGIGAFAKRCHENWPDARIICLEPDPVNLAALKANVAGFAEIVHGTISYAQSQPDTACATPDALPDTTIEQLMDQYGLRYIDLLKLSSASALNGCRRLACIGQIVGRSDDGQFEFPANQWHCNDMGNGIWHAHRIGERPTIARRDLKIALPPGIGDSLWPLVKLPALLDEAGCKKASLFVSASEPRRSKEFLERFDFVSKVEYKQFDVSMPPYVNEDGTYVYHDSQPHWHRQFDWFLQANSHLEHGLRLEDWLPQYPTTWDLASHFCFKASETQKARELRDKFGKEPYVVLYCGPEGGNTVSGHNRGGLWTPDDWSDLVCQIDLPVYITGAPYDRSYFDRYVRPKMSHRRHIDGIGATDIATTFAICQQAKAVISYQCGIGIFSAYLGVPVAMWWRPYGDSREEDHFSSFHEDMRTAWVPPDVLKSGRYFGLIYGRETPADIVAWLRRMP